MLSLPIIQETLYFDPQSKSTCAVNSEFEIIFFISSYKLKNLMIIILTKFAYQTSKVIFKGIISYLLIFFTFNLLEIDTNPGAPKELTSRFRSNWDLYKKVTENCKQFVIISKFDITFVSVDEKLSFEL